MTKQDLREYNFPDSDFTELHCRICGDRINKFGYARLLGTDVRYGWCRKYTHGVSVAKVIK